MSRSRETTGWSTGCSWPRPDGCGCCSSRATRGTTGGTSSRSSSASPRPSAGTSRSTWTRTWSAPVPDHPKQDRTSINRFPTPEELRKYDVVILGDVDPKQLPRADAVFESLAKYVKDQGGGLMMLAGEHANPHAYRDTPLADVMPVVCDGPAADRRRAAQGKLPAEVDAGRAGAPAVPVQHRGGGERRDLEPAAAAVLVRARATGGSWRPRCWPSTRTARPRGPAGPARTRTTRSSLQQFVGAGRVLFLGFDDTWRWRLRESRGAVQPVLAPGGPAPGPRAGRPDRGADRPQDLPPRRPDQGDRPVPRRRPAAGRAGTGDRGPRPPEAARQRRPGARKPDSPARLRAKGCGRRTKHSSPGPRRATTPSPWRARPLPGQRPRAEARILPPPGELDRIQLNESDMQRAARESRGMYYPLDRADRVPDELPAGPAGGARPAGRAAGPVEQPGPVRLGARTVDRGMGDAQEVAAVIVA